MTEDEKKGLRLIIQAIEYTARHNVQIMGTDAVVAVYEDMNEARSLLKLNDTAPDDQSPAEAR